MNVSGHVKDHMSMNRCARCTSVSGPARECEHEEVDKGWRECEQVCQGLQECEGVCECK